MFYHPWKNHIPVLNHIVFAFLLIVVGELLNWFVWAWWMIPLAVIFGNLPDIDTANSHIGRLTKPLSTYLETEYGHRTITHSLLALSAISAACYVCTWVYPWYTWWVPALFYASHIALDMIVGTTGVPLLYPAPHRFYLIRRIKANSAGERIVFISISALLIALSLYGTPNINAMLTRATGSLDYAVYQYREWQAFSDVLVDIQGTDQQTNEYIEGRYRVARIEGNTFYLEDGDLIRTAGQSNQEIYIRYVVAVKGAGHALRPTFTPTPSATPIPTIVSIRIAHVFDIDKELLVQVGDRIEQGQMLADLKTLRDTIAPPPTTTRLLMPTQAPTPFPTVQITGRVNQQVLAQAWADLQYAQAVATKAFRPPSADEIDRVCRSVTDGQSKLENMRNTLWARQLARDNQVVENELGWLEQKALEAPLLELERQIGEQEGQLIQFQADCAALRAQPYALDEYDRQIAAAALQRAYAVHGNRVATPTPLPSPTATVTPLPTVTPTPPDTADTFVYSYAGGDIHSIEVGTFTSEGANVLINVAIGYGQPLTTTTDTRVGTPLASSGTIQPYFTHNGTDIEQLLIERIRSTQATIDIAAFEFNLDAVATALIEAHQRGVQVRWLTDDEYGLAADNERGHGQFARLQAAGIAVRDDGRTALMHNKFWIFDRQAVWTGSTNITQNGTQRNNNNVILFDSPAVAEIYQREFEELWAGQFGASSPSTVGSQAADVNGTYVEVLFGPEDNVATQLTELIFSAEESIQFMAFSFTHDDMGSAMQQQAQVLGDVRGIFEARGSGTEYSELGRLYCESIADVRTDGNPATFHHKVIVIDDYITVTGSFNFSANADERNDENLVIVWSDEVAAHYLAEFERRWAEADSPTIRCP